MTNKHLYKQLCEKESTIPIFSKDWWLDAEAGEGNWDVVLVEENGHIIGSLPYYYVTTRWGRKHIVMPKLTQVMGPWLKYPDNAKNTTRLSFEKKVMTKLIEQLPDFDIFVQNFHYTISNWLPFFWKGFKQTTRYTYIIESLTDLDKVLSNFGRKAKEKIRKASKLVHVYTRDDIEKFYKINLMSFRRQNMTSPYDLDYLIRIDNACKIHQARKIFFAEDETGRIHSAIYVVWDTGSIYLLMSGGNPQLRSSGAKSLLVWEAIKQLHTIAPRFDFEGSMVEGIESYNRTFNAVQMQYFSISKIITKRQRIKNTFKKILNRGQTFQ